MMKMDLLRRQQDAVLNLAHRLLDLIDAYQDGNPGFPILMQLHRLFGVLRVHLALEDVELYPQLTASPDAKTASTAQLFSDEMGGLAEQLECFARQWSCSAGITSNFEEFREAAHDLVLSLAIRIERERHFLYPLARAA